MMAVPVLEASQVAEARRAALSLAQRAGFDEASAGRVALVATELSTNLVKHGGGGCLLAGLAEAPDSSGVVEMIALDKGPGIADLDAALRDGFSTAGSAGNGLGAVRRLAQDFDLFSTATGTAVLARLRADRRPLQPHPDHGAVCIPKPGEEVSGDDWHVADAGSTRTLMVVDGLGHGPQAAEAASEAVRLFKANAGLPLGAILETLHAGLRATRGAAVSVARLERGRVLFCGVGNVAGVLVAGGEARRMLSHNGTVGHAMRKVQVFEHSYDGDAPPVVVLCSDGIGTGWTPSRYPGLAAARASLIAAIIYRDHSRGRDDATVLAARPPPADGP